MCSKQFELFCLQPVSKRTTDVRLVLAPSLGLFQDALLLWAKRKCAGYAGVDITNFHMSWKDGLAFCALIHKHHPDLIDYDSLKKGDTMTNVSLAMKVAEEKLGLIPMVDAEDMAVAVKPDVSESRASCFTRTRRALLPRQLYILF